MNIKISKLKRKTKEIPEFDKIKGLYSLGYTVRSLSIEFKISYATLYRALKRSGAIIIKKKNNV